MPDVTNDSSLEVRYFVQRLEGGKGTSTVGMSGTPLREATLDEDGNIMGYYGALTGFYRYTYPDFYMDTLTPAGASWWLYNFTTNEWEPRDYPEDWQG